MRIRHPISFCMAALAVVLSAVTSVALHGILLVLLLGNLVLIGLLPTVSRLEVQYEASFRHWSERIRSLISR
jgi:protein-S-isoprenylcysteine O-methyltransferase Ste14